MIYRVAISVLIIIMLLPWFSPALSTLGPCPSCEDETCSLSIAECRHSSVCTMHKGGDIELHASASSASSGPHDKRHNGHLTSSGAEQGNRTEQAMENTEASKPQKCQTSLSCATPESDLLSVSLSEPHILPLLSSFGPDLSAVHPVAVGSGFLKSRYPAVIDRPPEL